MQSPGKQREPNGAQHATFGKLEGSSLDLRRGYEASYPSRQVNDSNKGSNGPAGSRSGKLHSERGVDSMGPKP